MVMNWAGSKVSPTELISEVYTPGKRGSLQMDLIAASRRGGYLAIPISGLNSLIIELSHGHPVIVFQNLAFAWAPKWHYAVVVGYDLNAQTIILNSGSDENKSMPMTYFERYWKLADYWGLIVLPSGQLSATADELSHMRAAAGLEQIGRVTEAELSYRKILERWPESFPALFGLGNLAYNRKDYRAAVKYFLRASKLRPASEAVRNNLALAKAAAR